MREGTRTWMPAEKRSYVEGCERRAKALGYARFEVLEGKRTWKEAARDLGTGERTLRRWRALERRGDAPAGGAGRPRTRLGRDGRREVLRLLLATGPSLGVAPLRRRFGGLSRAEGREILEKYRAHYRRTHERVVFDLRWHLAEAVWAADFTEIGGKHVLAVRELVRGRKVIWSVVEDLSAPELIACLRPVMERERPLVLKTDRGGAFRAQVFWDFLKERGVVILFSPPSRPEYNGAIESEIRWLKPLVRQAEERAGGKRKETLDEVRAVANELRADPGEAGGVSSPSEAERAAFQESVRRELAISLAEAHYGSEVPARVRRTLERLAIERALVAHGILEVRRRVIPLPKKLLFAA